MATTKRLYPRSETWEDAPLESPSRQLVADDWVRHQRPQEIVKIKEFSRPRPPRRGSAIRSKEQLFDLVERFDESQAAAALAIIRQLLAEPSSDWRLGASMGRAMRRTSDAVMVPVEVLCELTAERANSASQAAASVRAEGMELTAAVQAVTERWGRGEISTAQMRELIRQQYDVP